MRKLGAVLAFRPASFLLLALFFLPLLARAETTYFPKGNEGCSSQWILEDQASGKYHVVDRWSPTSDDNRHLENYVACCRYLLTLAKLEIPKSEDY